LAEGSFGLGTIDQVVPFHDSTSVLGLRPRAPTAVQVVGDTHDTAERPSPRESGFGLGTIDQVVPFHDSMRVLGPPFAAVPVPTAVQALADTHDTASSKLSGPAVFGLGTIDHAVPFQDSISVLYRLGAWKPTAMQALADTHDTPWSWL
jgi:hypothetical protein